MSAATEKLLLEIDAIDADITFIDDIANVDNGVPLNEALDQDRAKKLKARDKLVKRLSILNEKLQDKSSVIKG